MSTGGIAATMNGLARPVRASKGIAVNWILGLTVALGLLLLVGWGGLQVRPEPFPDERVPTTETRYVPLPGDLPVPVERFYRGLYGDRVPVIETVLLAGRATLRVAGVTLPARWRFVHDVGNAYRHEIVTSWFGLPLLRVDERYVDGVGRLELPFGVEEGPTVNQGANLALWAEAMWFPAALITDPRAEWEPVNDATALLRVPFGAITETFVARFDPASGQLVLLEAMRYKGADATDKTLWLSRAGSWGEVDRQPTATVALVQWLDEARPWADFRIERIVLNVSDAGARLRADR